MTLDIKTKILDAIGRTDDANLKMVLLLMLGVLETTHRAITDSIDELGAKIDALRGDKDGLRKAVLNEHESEHHRHHEWIAEKIADEAEREQARRDDKRVAREAAIRQIVTVGVSAAIGAISVLWVVK